MPKDQYSLRSKEVQEVLSTPPRRVIFWGNIIILCCFIIFLIVLDNVKMPIKIRLDGEITNVYKEGSESEIQVLANTSLIHKLRAGDQVRIIYLVNDRNTVITGSIKHLNLKDRIVNIKTGESVGFLSNCINDKLKKYKTYIHSVLEANIDTVSTLSLFRLNLVKHFDN